MPTNSTACRVSAGCKPRGMTLVEVLLVTGLLVIIGSMVVPVFTGSFSSVRLRRAGDQVLSRWAHARARAVETGEVHQFCFTPESGSYKVEVWAPVDPEQTIAAAVARPSRSSAGTTSSGGAGPQTTDEGLPTSNGVLPEPITFHSGQIATTAAGEGDGRGRSPRLLGDSASAPILFYPDGSTSDASVTLVNEGEQYLRLTLRGLTGVGRASDVLSRSELDRLKAR